MSVVLVTAVGAASGSRAAAAALACAGSEPDRPGLLIDVGGRPPRPTLVASSGGARAGGAAHGPPAPVARSLARADLPPRGRGEPEASTRSARPCPSCATRSRCCRCRRRWCRTCSPRRAPDSRRPAARRPRRRACAHRARRPRPARRGLAGRVLKRPLAWVPARRALFGVLPPQAPGGLPSHVRRGFGKQRSQLEHACYSGRDDGDAEIDPEGTAQQQRRGDAGAGQGRGLHRHQKRQAGR